MYVSMSRRPRDDSVIYRHGMLIRLAGRLGTHLWANGSVRFACISRRAGAGLGACGPSPPADCASTGQADGPGGWEAGLGGEVWVLERCAGGGWSSCFVSPTAISPSTTPPRQRSMQSPRSHYHHNHNHTAPVDAICRRPRSSPVLARLEATPPRRLVKGIHWTPACRSMKHLSNHTPVPPRQAITPGLAFPRSPTRRERWPTCRPLLEILPVPAAHHVASCYTLHLTRILSVGKRATCRIALADQDRRLSAV